MVPDYQKKARDKWDKNNMAVISCKIKRETADEFRRICRENGVTPSAVLTQAVNNYIEKNI